MKTSPALPSWRSLLFVPATSDRFVESALRQPADALQIDLEDSVAPDQKQLARERLPAIAAKFSQAGYGVVVRLNRPWRQLVRDLEAAVQPEVEAVCLPKVPDAAFVRAVAEVLAELEQEAGMEIGHTRIIAMIEDPEGLENMSAIASAHARVCAIIVGAEDLALTMRMDVSEDSLYLWNVMAVAAARRAGVMALGFVGSVADFADPEAFRQRIKRARGLGFEGAFCIQPKQVPIVNDEFSPTAEQVVHARALLAEFALQEAAGKVAFSFKGRMVDMPVVGQARQIVERQENLERRAGKDGGA